ncbi:helix-turn-helix protein [Variibacter gotjawalensis]|uniref:Helix-turn-helix protein n=1 Tax=Variibacter gotjawalensis TaxID=1333996 RepID=A0A0S3PZ32_9BRAD|nr:helix-turn-helix transcriptional regulator [Variibacter gotjawalensis]NIK47029.1 transcriptional regulator with XRE-family HTH domain [Variibacter gotjawalensis]RZS48934.1 DNA-binding XRE family transcriptional regulator [Variibacter gotjawalensis]BAT61192.1 helix-turn-helix protein [Variibacter gotjawalensis]
MAKPITRASSQYSQDAVALLGQLIRRGRIDRKMTAAELAERAGVSRGLVQRIEKGDLGSSIGAAFEVAAVAGVNLFGTDQAGIAYALHGNAATLALLPKSVRARKIETQDDF